MWPRMTEEETNPSLLTNEEERQGARSSILYLQSVLSSTPISTKNENVGSDVQQRLLECCIDVLNGTRVLLFFCSFVRDSLFCSFSSRTSRHSREEVKVR